jgi:hypothetical protein
MRGPSPPTSNTGSTITSPRVATYRADHRRTGWGAVLASLPPVALVLAAVLPATAVALAVGLAVGLTFPLALSRVRSDGD